MDYINQNPDKSLSTRSLMTQLTLDDTDSESDDCETFFIPLDMSWAPQQAFDEEAKIQLTGLDEEKPIIRIGANLYEGRWENMIGSELYFNTDAEYIGMTRERLRLIPGKAVKIDDSQNQDKVGKKSTKTKKPNLIDKALAMDKENADKIREKNEKLNKINIDQNTETHTNTDTQDKEIKDIDNKEIEDKMQID